MDTQRTLLEIVSCRGSNEKQPNGPLAARRINGPENANTRSTPNPQECEARQCVPLFVLVLSGSCRREQSASGRA